ncbi:MAG: hypothetical protein ACP5RG_00070 [Thermoplasmata archaeon]
MNNDVYSERNEMDYWDRRARRDLILGLIFVAIAASILASLFIQL